MPTPGATGVADGNDNDTDNDPDNDTDNDNDNSNDNDGDDNDNDATSMSPPVAGTSMYHFRYHLIVRLTMGSPNSHFRGPWRHWQR